MRTDPGGRSPTGSAESVMEPHRTVVCTIVSANYLARARVLMESVEEHHPEWDRHVLLVDENRGRFDPDEERFSLREARALGLEDSHQLFFRYSVLELNTAMKAPFIRWLFDDCGYDRVVYLDPDIELHAPLDEVERAFEAGALMCLTPHLVGRNADERKPTELEILRAGSFNLGFIALGRHPELDDVFDWWWEKLEFDCLVDFESGLFVDQKWMDLAPGLFSDVWIIRHPGYNVAYWNMGHRRIVRSDDGYRVAGFPLVFFHFSGLDPMAPSAFSVHQDRFVLDQLGDARDLVLGYCDRILRAGEEECRKYDYTYGSFADGTPIVDAVRVLYRDSTTIQREAKDDPFALGSAYFNAPVDGRYDRPIVSRLAYHIWSRRTDVQRHYADPLGAHRESFVRWFVDCAPDEHGLPDAYVSDVKRSLLLSRNLRPARVRAREFLRALAHRVKPYLSAYVPYRLRQALKRWVMGDPPAAGSLATVSPHRGPRYRPFRGFFEQDVHDIATGQAWMGASGEILLPEGEVERITLVGEHHADRHERSHGERSLEIDVELDGRRVGAIRIQDGGTFVESMDVPPWVEAPRVLGLIPRRTFVPAECSDSDDARELSVRIARVSLQDRSLLDFGKVDRSYVPDRPGPQARLGLNLVGYFRQDLGIGESVRLGAVTASAGGIPVRMINFSEGCTSRAGDERFEKQLSDTNPYVVNVLHVNADQLPLAVGHLGPSFFAGRYNIGVWHWELPEFPDEWWASFQLLDEIWAPSRFVQDALSAKSPIPVIHMPHAISIPKPEGATRAEFALEEGRFLFLTMYDMHSFQARKNPEAVIEAFRLAFPDPDRVGAGLVVKVMNATSTPRDAQALRDRVKRVPGIQLLDDTLHRDEVYRLESVCDAFVSLHRSEGFGLGLAECMALGKPVIGTGWSGNMDFMEPGNSIPVDFSLVPIREDHGPYRRGQIWAEPDIEDAARAMRRLVDNPELARSLGRRGARTVQQRLAPSVLANRQRARIVEITKRLSFG